MHIHPYQIGNDFNESLFSVVFFTQFILPFFKTLPVFHSTTSTAATMASMCGAAPSVFFSAVDVSDTRVLHDTPPRLELDQKVSGPFPNVDDDALSDARVLRDTPPRLELDQKVTGPFPDQYYDALKGDADAQYRLGRYFLHGWGPSTQNTTQAVDWIGKAAAQNHVRALERLAFLHRSGNLGERDHRVAVSLYRRAADMGSVKSMYLLGQYYADCGFRYKGHGAPPKDMRNAEWYYRQAVGGVSPPFTGIVYFAKFLRQRDGPRPRADTIHWNTYVASEPTRRPASVRHPQCVVALEYLKGIRPRPRQSRL